MRSTCVCTECGVDQVSLLVNACYSLVAQTLATLLYLPVAFPALNGSWICWVGEDASRPVPIGLGQMLFTGTSLWLLQWVQLLIKAMLLLFTATWKEDGQKNVKQVCTEGGVQLNGFVQSWNWKLEFIDSQRVNKKVIKPKW